LKNFDGVLLLLIDEKERRMTSDEKEKNEKKSIWKRQKGKAANSFHRIKSESGKKN